MTDYEEPAAKVSKMQLDSKEPDEEMDEGHEEWLSEGILTDDDCNLTGDQIESNINASQGNTTPSVADDDILDNLDVREQSNSTNIEQALDNLENSKQSDLPGELGTFLVRKTNEKVADKQKADSDLDESIKHSDDDGHDTDELLRMLGEENQKTKKVVKKLDQKHDLETQSSEEDDDEYIFDGAKVSRLKVAKNAILKKYPTKAVPEKIEDDDMTDMSSDEAVAVKKMFSVVRKSANVACKSTAKPLRVLNDGKLQRKVISSKSEKSPATSISSVKQKSKPHLKHQEQMLKSKRTSSPKNRVTSASINTKDIPKKTSTQIKKVDKDQIKHEISSSFRRVVKESIKKEPIKKEVIKKKELEEIIDEDGFLEEESEFDLEEDFESEPEEKGKQRIMRPEQMDEEVPTDGESHSEDDDNIYDELPSSDSDQSDFFTLDIRSERAGDYIPLLGAKAHQILLAEKQRVAAGLTSLRQSMSALNETSEQQAEMLRKATLQLAELDAALKV